MSVAEYRVAHRHAFDQLAPKARREAVARHDLLQTHITEFVSDDATRFKTPAAEPLAEGQHDTDTGRSRSPGGPREKSRGRTLLSPHGMALGVSQSYSARDCDRPGDTTNARTHTERGDRR